MTPCSGVATRGATKTGSLEAGNAAASGTQGGGVISTFQVLDLVGVSCSGPSL